MLKSSVNMHGFTPRGFISWKSKIRISNGMIQSTHKSMNFIKSVVIEKWDRKTEMSLEIHIPWQKFADYYIKAGKDAGSVKGVTWQDQCSKDEEGNLHYGPMKFFGGNYSFAKLYSHWDADKKAHIPSRVVVGLSEATALLFDDKEY